MKKTLLLCAFALSSLMASAGDGLVAVGANIPLLPSTYWDGDIEWKAMTWVYNTGNNYGEWNSWNPNYNIVCGRFLPDDEEYIDAGPAMDANGLRWYEPGFDMGEKEDDLNGDTFEPIVWEEHTAPFSSDETFNGRRSYRWTTQDIIADIYVRRTFTTDQLLSGPVYLACGHDDAPCEYYINGELVFQRTGFEGQYETTDGNIAYANAWNNAEYILLTDEQKALIKLNGEENVVAFHVHQNWGGAFADCGLYTKLEGGLDMGYTTPWEGKVLFNNTGGYNNDGASPSNNPKHPWSALYVAQEGDVYSFVMPGNSNLNDVDDDPYWKEQLHFKTPINIEDGRNYSFKVRLETDKTFKNVIVKLTDNDNDDIELAYEEVEVAAPEEGEEDYEGTFIELEFDGQNDIDATTGEEKSLNFKVAFDFGGGEEGATVTLKDFSLLDITEGSTEEDAVELWVGTNYFNYIDMHKRVTKYYVWDQTLNDGNGDYREAKDMEEYESESDTYEEVVYEAADAPEITGRVETLAWTQVDFDDSMWDNQMMPTGSAGYMAEQQSIWPSGIDACYNSSNYWIRRNFELDKINDRLSYELNVCHDDVYETYVNGVLLQKNVGWTNGKNPVQVHIPARYLNVGKNVIATYIQQNWGGYFYDCGINVTEVNYEECLKLFNDALAYAETDTLLTNRMRADVKAIVAKAKQFFQENKNDAAELRAYARDSIRPNVNAIFAYSKDVKVLKDTWNLCRFMEDKGYWGTALTDATAALDTCATANDINKYLQSLREARKATNMERHTENYVGSVPQAVTMEEIGEVDFDYTDPMDDERPKYYIYNVGAKNFLGGGEDWGAHLVLEYISNPRMLVQAMKDVVDDESGEIIDEEPIEGAFYIETFRPNGEFGSMDFMGWNGYIDCPMGDNRWELIPVEGKPNVYNIAQYGQTFGEADTTCYAGTIFEPGGKKYLGLRSGDNRYAPSYYLVDTDMHSPELETNQWMFISRKELLGFIKNASEENPVDLSFLIKNPGYDQRWSIDDWTFFNGSVWGRGGNNPNFVLESYNSKEFDNSQELWPNEGEEALPAGYYVLKVQGYYRDGIEQAHVVKVLNGEPILQRSYIFAGPMTYLEDPEACETMPLMPIHIEANMVPGIGYTYGGLSMPGTYNGQPYSACTQAAQDYFGNGLYWNEVVFQIPEDDPGHVAIGIHKEYDEETAPGDWIVMDNWRLVYYGKDVQNPDAIKGIESDEINNNITTAAKGIYNMLGQRLNKVQKGVNIIGGRKVVKK